MPKENFLAIDVTKKDVMRQLLPHAPLLSSHKAGWNGIDLAHYRQPPHEIPECSFAQHIISIYVGQPGIKLIVNGDYQREYSAKGDIDIFPASQNLRIGWDGESEVIHLYLEPAKLATIAYEFINPECIELVPQFQRFDPLIQHIGLALKSELESDPVGSHLYAESMATALLVHLLRRYSIYQHPIRDYTGGLPKYKLKQAIAYINDHLDRDITLTEIAAVVQMSPHYFASLFKQSTGLAPYQYVTQCRIERAKCLLRHCELPIIEICHQVGFQSQSHFTKVFRRHTANTPKAYRDAL